jgi:hypothetical protein
MVSGTFSEAGQKMGRGKAPQVCSSPLGIESQQSRVGGLGQRYSAWAFVPREFLPKEFILRWPLRQDCNGKRAQRSREG